MFVSNKFTIAVHTLLCIQHFGKDFKVTSDFIASSVGANPVIIRRTLIALKAAGLIEVAQGTGGARLIKKPREINLYDIYAAVDDAGKRLFHFHEQPNPRCPVGRNIHSVLDGHLDAAQKSFEASLAAVNLADLVADLAKKI